MRFKVLHGAILIAALLVSATAARSASIADQGPAVWSIDPSRSEVRFTVTKLGFEDVAGVFRESEGEIQYDPNRAEASRVRWRVRVASVLTDATNRDQALQQPDYFDAARYPFLEFVSQSVRRVDADRFEVSGAITIRGVSRPITFIVRALRGDGPLRFETDFTVDRYDFGVRGGTVLGRLIGRTVRVHLLAAVNQNFAGERVAAGPD